MHAQECHGHDQETTQMTLIVEWVKKLWYSLYSNENVQPQAITFVNFMNIIILEKRR